MYFRKMIICITAAMTFASCADVPDNVRSKAEEREAMESTAHEAGPELIRTDDLSEDIDKALAENYSNFKLASGIKVQIPEAFVECDFRQVDGFSEKADEIMGRFFPAEMTEGIKPEAFEDSFSENYVNISRGFRDEERQIHYFLWDNGFLCFMKPLLFNEQTAGGKTVRIYHADRGDDLSDKYLLGDSEVSVKAAADAANKWLAEKYADLEPDYRISVKTVLVKLNDYGEYSFQLYVDKSYKGIELDELNTIIDISDTDKHRYKYVNQRILMIMKSGTDIDYFTNSTGILKPVEKQSIDKIISLSSALRSIETTFTDFDDPPEINSIRLKYTLSPQYSSDDDIPVYAPETLNTGRIVWEFVIDVPPETISNDNENGDVRKYVYVDAQDGSIDYEFDINRLWQ